jgi:hypothetical protein
MEELLPSVMKTHNAFLVMNYLSSHHAEKLQRIIKGE